ncbi:unnamed protein product [Lactuca virosa]|uniref:Receptor-like serine/threonine-protein kinase n=1 Tax=Lactuca virosa TaxID=75947 RepID=A0AAU9MJY5_9ASTR|nr:unnamed protein product [Lactuca virosa]
MSSLLIYTLLCTNLIINCFPAIDVSTIKVGDQLNRTSQLVSPGNNFTLGFFNHSDSNNTYLGIWYTNQSTKVWVANPSTPIIFRSSVLRIDPDTGKLIITTGETTLVNISDNQFTPGSNLTAKLEDTGNFQLKNETDNQTLWQSFDHPTNVLLPGMKLGANLRTEQSWNLTSWLYDDISNDNSFTPGTFTLSWEATDEASQRFIIRRRGQPYWTSGNLNNQTFPNIMLNSSFSQYMDNLSYVYSNVERYFSFHVVSGVRPMWILTPDGMLLDGERSMSLTPLSENEFCYGYETSTGCLEVPGLAHECRSKNANFTLLSGEYPTDSRVRRSDAGNSSLSRSDCMMRCWNDCSCLAFEEYEYGNDCITYTGDKSTKLITDTRGYDRQMFVLESQDASKDISASIWAAAVAGIFLLFFCFGLLWYLKKRNLRLEAEERQRRDDEYFLGLMASDSFHNATNLDSNGRKISEMMVFSHASIVASTNNFASKNKLGEGGFGPVYKGKLSDGQDIAIKRLSRASGQGLVEFKNELVLITKIQHTKLVRILGCCVHGEEKMLIYEYMPNKSLDFFLFDERRKGLLDWTKRWNIIEGIAQDESMNPKISDFGMARIFKQHETEAMTNRVVGTYGYMAPEYAMEGTFSVKSDVFSFGVLTLEIVSGRRNTSFSYRDKTVNLIGYAWELWLEGNALELEDPTLSNTHVIHQLLRTIHVALLCVQENAMDRPEMSDVLSMLNNDTMSLPVPKRPAFFIGRSSSKSTSDERKLNDYSVNKMTVTLMEAR